MLLNASRKKHYTDVELTSNDLDIILHALATQRRELFEMSKDESYSKDIRTSALDESMDLDKLADRLYEIWQQIR